MFFLVCYKNTQPSSIQIDLLSEYYDILSHLEVIFILTYIATELDIQILV